MSSRLEQHGSLGLTDTASSFLLPFRWYNLLLFYPSAIGDQRWNFENDFVWIVVLADLYNYYIAPMLCPRTCA